MYVHTCIYPEVEFLGPNYMCNFDEYCQITFYMRYYFLVEMYMDACFFT